MDIGSYFNYALRLWSFDESAAQELRDSEASSTWTSLLIVAIFGVIIGLISIFTELLNQSSMSSLELVAFFIGGGIIFLPLFYILFMLWNQLWINIFGGDRKFLKTFEVFMCIYIPSFIVAIFISILQLILTISIDSETTLGLAMLLPVLISLGFGIYAVIVTVKTFSITHNMGTTNAFLAGLAPTIIIMIIAFIILFVIFIILIEAMGQPVPGI